MNTRTLLSRLVSIALTGLACTAGCVQAQNMWAQNAAFDRQFNGWLSNAQQQNAQAQQQLWQRHLRVNGPRLQQQYAQLLASGNRSMSFEQFAYWDLMTAAGTNVQGALQHQQNQFRGLQAAHATVQQGHAGYNAGWAQNSQRQSAAVANYSNQAIRGMSPYVDPNSGRTTMLPYSLPAGQVYQSGGNTYAQHRSGVYYQLQNNAWVRMDAAGR